MLLEKLKNNTVFLLLFSIPEFYLIQTIGPQSILEWLEVLGLLCSGAGGAWVFFRKEEGKRLKSIENAQEKIVKGYNSLLEEFQESGKEKELELKSLDRENRNLFKEVSNLKLIIKQQQGIIEALKYFNKTILETDSEEMRDFLKTAPIMEMLNAEKSIREVLLERVERRPNRD